MTTGSLADAALAQYPVSGVLADLPGEVDDNYLVEDGGRRFVLRISPANTPLEVVRFQVELLNRFAEHGISAPTPVSSVDGAEYVVVGAGRIARLVSWVPGEPYDVAGRPADLARPIGRLAGSIVGALVGFDHPGSRREHVWDLARAVDVIGDNSPFILSWPKRQLVVSVAERMRSVEIAGLPHQVIHNDLNDDNLLVADGAISGVIDVGDALWSPRIVEAVVATTYAMFGRDDPVGIGAEVLRGFAEKVEVTPSEANVMIDLILARLAMSVSLSAARGGRNPHHVRSEELAWDLLERLAAADREQIGVEWSNSLGIEGKTRDHDLLAKRHDVLGTALSVSYDEPLRIVRGSGQYLFDSRGRRFLDCVNNVAHVGHGNSRVLEAATRQMSLLNTNTRYLHDEILNYASRLRATLPQELEVVYLVNSGSEANELAIRMARAATGRYGMACLENGYHGNTSTLIDVSHYKFAGPGGSGRRDWVTVLPSPDPYRNEAFRGSGARTAYMGETLHRLGRQPLEVAGLIAESLPGVAGQICPEPDVVTGYWELIRESGGVIIADEVQAGFGRVGEHFWSFDLFGGHPDIVTMGKPIGNGHPLGAVVATRRIAEAFDNGMEYFNTFGGNPVSAAVGNAVLDVIEEDGLQARALAVGARLKHLLAGLAADHEGIGDVRGAGLFLGIELVADRERKIPNPDLAKRIVESSKRDGVLLSVDGPDHNVIKIKPPMVFDDANSDRLVGVLDAAFRSVVV